MDWSQFADPQILLGMGVFAFGVINAYMLRRQNHRLAADAVAHTGEQGPEIAEQSEVRQRTSATESSNIIGQINRKEEGEGLEATDETPTRSAGTEGDRVSASEPQLSPSPPTVLPSMRVRFENQVFEMEGNDHISRRRETGVRFRDEVDAKIMGASRDDPVMIERELNEGDVQKGKEEDELSDSSDTFTIEPNLILRWNKHSRLHGRALFLSSLLRTA
ncbi:hypothetical protein [Echinococcus multilocularis]|uniref:Uncharacterized protein n=1 Tax=Echinococcus multilocularis TaxID=6211 RepID=A0A068Y8F3_ECHMU|nr:hypothetical protein [Echinococcus multilocularis]